MIAPTKREWPVAKTLVAIKQPIAQTAIRRWRRLNAPVLPRITGPDGRVHFWEDGGGFDRNVRTEAEFLREIGYIHRNPVKRALVEKPEHWAGNSARWYAGDRAGPVEIGG